MAGVGEGLTVVVAAGGLAAEVASRRVRLNVVALEARYLRSARHEVEDRLMRMSRQAGIRVTRDELTPLSKQLASRLLGLEGRLALLSEFDEEEA